MWYTLYSLVKEQRSIFAAQKLILTQFPLPVKALIGSAMGETLPCDLLTVKGFFAARIRAFFPYYSKRIPMRFLGPQLSQN